LAEAFPCGDPQTRIPVTNITYLVVLPPYPPTIREGGDHDKQHAI
jgi:hypothetical protein